MGGRMKKVLRIVDRHEDAPLEAWGQ
jgi:hypothetical protein